MPKEYDLVVYGATGFTGQLVTEYLSQNYPEASGIRWAVAGRNLNKLKDVLSKQGLNVDMLRADSNDPKSLSDLVEKAKVVVTTVGPYLRYGEPLVQACIAGGAHYCDLTGEVPFIHRMRQTYHQEAQHQQVKIVHSCGFDSIPSDIGCALLQEKAIEHGGKAFPTVKFYLKGMKGSFSRGTAESMMEVVNLGKDKAVRKLLADVNVLTDLPPLYGVDQKAVHFDRDYRVWTAPFVMEAVNSRIVRCSNYLLGYPWGRDFHYSETMVAGKGPMDAAKAQVQHLMVVGFALSALHPTTRKLASKALPAPGSGPDRDEREQGYFKVALQGLDAEGNLGDCVEFIGPKDPGYGSTAIMLAESAIALSRGETTDLYGVGTPASLIGTSLVPRLNEKGFKIAYVSSSSRMN